MTSGNQTFTQIRYGLAYKGLAFKTEWVEYPDIEALCKKIGAPPTWTKSDGSALYTLPVIYDPHTKTVVEESFKIAKYLDETYPDTPRLIPDNTAGLQSGFRMGFEMNVANSLYDLVVLAAHDNLNPRSQEFFRRTREEEGPKLEEYVPSEEVRQKLLEDVRRGLQKVSSWLDHNGGTGPFVMGSILSHADFAIAGRLMWAKVTLGEDAVEWRNESWCEDPCKKLRESEVRVVASISGTVLVTNV